MDPRKAWLASAREDCRVAPLDDSPPRARLARTRSSQTMDWTLGRVQSGVARGKRQVQGSVLMRPASGRN